MKKTKKNYIWKERLHNNPFVSNKLCFLSNSSSSSLLFWCYACTTERWIFRSKSRLNQLSIRNDALVILQSKWRIIFFLLFSLMQFHCILIVVFNNFPSLDERRAWNLFSVLPIELCVCVLNESPHFIREPKWN